MSTNDSISQFVTFVIDNNYYGINILDIKEIQSEFSITPVFHASNEVLGFVNLRGQIYLIIDIRVILGKEKIQKTEFDLVEEKLVIFKESLGDPFGIIVDHIGDVEEIDNDMIETFKSLTDSKNEDLKNLSTLELVEGISRLDDKLLILLRSRNLLNTIENKH
jgi:chemotaxis signal transduction protein